jgi:hypothetical protein
MPRLTLTDLIEVVTKAGTQKATKVAQIKHRDAYDPAVDFYKRFRERVCEVHKAGLGKPELRSVLVGLSDPKKSANYPGVVAGYTKWWGRKELKWFSPPSTTYSASGIDVAVNPELGLEINGVPHVLKMHIKTEQLAKMKADLITAFLVEVLSPVATRESVFGVLDVRNAKLFEASSSKRNLKAMIDAELAYVASLWPSV